MSNGSFAWLSGGALWPWALPPNRSVLVEAPTVEPLTVAEAKLRSGLDWPADDAARDAQMEGFIRAARERVERDTGYALLTQTRDVYLSHLTHVIDFPAPARPLQEISEITGIDDEGASHVLALSDWELVGDRLIWTRPADWTFAPADLYPWVVRIVVGWEDVADIPPLLLFAVGLLTAHYATAARDAVVIGTIATEVPLGYMDAIADFRQVAV